MRDSQQAATSAKPHVAVCLPNHQLARPPMRRLTGSRPKDAHQHNTNPDCPLRRRRQRRSDIATILAYERFCRLHPAYRHSMSNQIRIFEWLDVRRVEMRAEGRAHWVPSMRDFEMAERDCWDDLLGTNGVNSPRLF